MNIQEDIRREKNLRRKQRGEIAGSSPETSLKLETILKNGEDSGEVDDGYLPDAKARGITSPHAEELTEEIDEAGIREVACDCGTGGD